MTDDKLRRLREWAEQRGHIAPFRAPWVEVVAEIDRLLAEPASEPYRIDPPLPRRVPKFTFDPPDPDEVPSSGEPQPSADATRILVKDQQGGPPTMVVTGPEIKGTGALDIAMQALETCTARYSAEQAHAVAKAFVPVMRQRDGCLKQTLDLQQEKLVLRSNLAQSIAESDRLRGVAEGAKSERDEARAECERLQKEAEAFHMDYRMKCDADTKAMAVECARLREQVQRYITTVDVLALRLALNSSRASLLTEKQP